MEGELADNLESGYVSLREAARTAGLTDMGQAWLVKSLDPFHDAPTKVRGYPDGCYQRSIVREIEYTSQIAVSEFPGFSPSGTWQFQVSLLPLLNTVPFTQGIVKSESRTEITFNGKDLNTRALGSINICVGNDGAWYPWPAPAQNTAAMFSTPHKAISPLGDAIQIEEGTQYRLIGVAFEIHDTTKTDDKQGICHVYRMNSIFDREKRPLELLDTNGLQSGLTICELFQTPFNDPTVAQRAAINYRQWPSYEGAYCVGVMDVDDIPHFRDRHTRDVYIGTDTVRINRNYGGPANQQKRSLLVPVRSIPYYDTDVDNTYVDSLPVIPTNFETTVAHFTGLNPSAVFQLNVKWVIEEIPEPYNANVTLADMSAPYDPQAIELYKHMCKAIPAGVFVRLNPFGEWFDTVMRFLAKAAPKVGGLVDAATGMTGLGGLAGNAVSNLADYFRETNAAERERAKKRRRLAGSV